MRVVSLPSSCPLNIDSRVRVLLFLATKSTKKSILLACRLGLEKRKRRKIICNMLGNRLGSDVHTLLLPISHPIIWFHLTVKEDGITAQKTGKLGLVNEE